jgi:hypothetical protein
VDITAHPPIDVTDISTPDLEALVVIFGKHRPNAGELVASAQILHSYEELGFDDVIVGLAPMSDHSLDRLAQARQM